MNWLPLKAVFIEVLQGMVIRKYRPSDKYALLEILSLNTPAYFAAEEVGDYLFYLDHYSGNYFVVEEERTVAGGGGFNLSEDQTRGFISWDVFHPSCQGKGYGRALTQYRFTQLRKISTVQGVTVRTSQHAFRFYEKMGFELREVINNYWASGFDLYRMELDHFRL